MKHTIHTEHNVTVKRGSIGEIFVSPGKCPHALCIICIGGTARVWLNLKEYRLSRGSELIILPDGVVAADCASDDFDAISVEVERELFDKLTNQFEARFFQHLLSHPLRELPSHIANMAESLYRIILGTSLDVDNRFRSSIIGNYLRSILLNVYSTIEPSDDDPSQSEITRPELIYHKFIDLLLNNRNMHRDVDYFAHRLCITKSYLASITRKIRGRTPKQIIDDHIVRAIKMRLAFSDDSLQQIAEDMNFPDQSYLGRYFKRHTGMHPSAFRAIRTTLDKPEL